MLLPSSRRKVVDVHKTLVLLVVIKHGLSLGEMPWDRVLAS